MNAVALLCHAAVACGLLWRAAGAPAAVDASGSACCGGRNATADAPVCGLRRALPAHDVRRWWTAAPRWYRACIGLAECASAVCVALTLTAYALIPKRHDVSNYGRHYLACLLATTLVRLVDEVTAAADVFGDRPSFCYLKLFAIVCTHSWQIVMSIEIYCFLRCIDKLNSFTANIPFRNKVYHIFCWLFSTAWTFAAVSFEYHDRHPIPDTIILKFGSKNCWMSNLIFNYRQAIFLLFPGLINITVNLIIFLLYTIRYDSKIRSKQDGSKCIEKLLIRKQLSVLLALVWLIDFMSFVDHNDAWLSRKIVRDVGKSLQGVVACFILVFKLNVMSELRKAVGRQFREHPNLNGRRSPPPDIKF